ncbi:beta-lactamase (plasmid) [Gemmatirosa kalamazoonensis]|uniref:Beta-lactamase n=1 Tax=Gemmatirosa kalamazoonensis TaxID=861299 RepID=W0RRB9_9BACT|nr:serine hydrolase domain-containing protein [Gemmatirosa kalamazoonensis]AHG93221.1 beta-lactamase [Gemmatirosa kalamazoonensis]
MSLLSLPVAARAQHAAGPVPPRLDTTVVAGALGARLDSLLERYAEYGYGGTALVVRRGAVVLLKGYGWADREARVPNGPTTYYDFGSITKTLTGAAVLALEAEGRLSTTDLLSRWLGPMPPSKAGATVEHLAKHTSGLVADGAPVGDTSRRVFMTQMRDTPAESAPGERYRYTNAGVSLLAAIVEEASGRPYADYVRDVLLRPAGIDAAFSWEPAWARRRARGYVAAPGHPPELVPDRPLVWGSRGAGGWIATVGDVYRWHVALFGETLLPPAQRARLLDSTATEAYGWRYEPHGRNGAPVVSKGGDTPGFHSQLLHYPRQDVVIVWVNNDRRHRWRDLLNEGLTRLALGETPLPLPPRVTPLGDRALAALAGRYEAAAGGAVELRAATGQGYLYVAAADSLPRETMYFPVGPLRFVGLPARGATPLTLEFRRDGSASVRALAWSDGRRAMTARRVSSGRR